MKRIYQSPEITVVSLQNEAIMTASEETFDIEVSFDSLWGGNA